MPPYHICMVDRHTTASKDQELVCRLDLSLLVDSDLHAARQDLVVDFCLAFRSSLVQSNASNSTNLLRVSKSLHQDICNVVRIVQQ